MRFDTDALVLIAVFSALVLLAGVLLPLIGYVGAGVAMATPAAILDACLVVEVLRSRGGEGSDGSGGGGTPGRRGPPGGSGVREPRRPRNRPPAASIRR